MDEKEEFRSRAAEVEKVQLSQRQLVEDLLGKAKTVADLKNVLTEMMKLIGPRE